MIFCLAVQLCLTWERSSDGRRLPLSSSLCLSLPVSLSSFWLSSCLDEWNPFFCNNRPCPSEGMKEINEGVGWINGGQLESGWRQAGWLGLRASCSEQFVRHAPCLIIHNPEEGLFISPDLFPRLIDDWWPNKQKPASFLFVWILADQWRSPFFFSVEKQKGDH